MAEILRSGVKHAAFPDLVPELNDPNNTESNAPFDTTFAKFDNKMLVFKRIPCHFLMFYHAQCK
jgi:hypothetical protein